jgi:hypothetical protein
MALPSIKNNLKSLHAEPVQCGGAVEDYGILLHNIIKNIPDFFGALFHHLPRTLDGGNVSFPLQFIIDEWFEQLQSHFFGQTALMETEMWADDNNRTSGIIDPFPQKILAETALFALEHIRKRFERSFVGSGDGATATSVVEQDVNGFLKHSLLVADDDVRCIQFQQPL